MLVLGLLFALPMKARFTAYRFHGWDWAGALLTTAGLAVFLVVSRPAAGHTNVSARDLDSGVDWRRRISGCPGGPRSPELPRWKAVSYGAAGGIVYGACAALTKSCAHLLSLGVSHLFQSWQPYLLAGAGVAGMVLAQSAFQAGPLDASLPTLSATDPIVSVLVGAVAFGEALRVGVAETTLEVLSFSAVVAGIFLLAHTEAVNAAQRHHLEVDQPGWLSL